MPDTSSDTTRRMIRAWLRNERRLGVTHLPLMPHDLAAAADRAVRPAPSAPEPAATAAAPAALFEMDPEGFPPLNSAELSPADAAEALQALDERFVRDCTRCGLCEQRTQTVFGVGTSRPEIVFVGEGPGQEEDRQGKPFVGRAGELLTRMIAAMTLSRDDVYICNVVKCRPPGNRTPNEDEMLTCLPYLHRQLAILRPRVIVALGRPAAQTLLDTKAPISRLRGQFHDYPAPSRAHITELPRCPVMPTFHPAYLLRSPGEKAKAWEDLKQVMRHLGIPIPNRR